MKAVQISRHIEVNNVSFFKFSSIRNSMTNYFVDRCAATARESIVIQRGGVATVTGDIVVDGLVDRLCGDADGDKGVAGIERFTGEAGSFPDSFKVSRIIDGYGLITQLLEALIRLTRGRIIRLFDLLINLPTPSKTVRRRAERSSILAVFC
jgi:hypothetical protein